MGLAMIAVKFLNLLQYQQWLHSQANYLKLYNPFAKDSWREQEKALSFITVTKWLGQMAKSRQGNELGLFLWNVQHIFSQFHLFFCLTCNRFFPSKIRPVW